MALSPAERAKAGERRYRIVRKWERGVRQEKRKRAAAKPAPARKIKGQGTTWTPGGQKRSQRIGRSKSRRRR